LATVDEVTGDWWAMLDHGHWGCKLHRSRDGEKWEELEAQKYPEGEEIKEGQTATTKYLWAFSNGGADRAGTIFLGTDPGWLFKSTDNGKTFELVGGLWDHPSREKQWFGGGRDNPGIHSILTRVIHDTFKNYNLKWLITIDYKLLMKGLTLHIA